MEGLSLFVKVVVFAATLFVAKVQSMPPMLPLAISGDGENSFLRPLLIDSYVNCSAYCLVDVECVGFTIFQVKVITENDPIFWCRTSVEHNNEDLQKGNIAYTAILRDKLPKVVRAPPRPVAKSKLHVRSRRDFSDDEHVFNQNAVPDVNPTDEFKATSANLLKNPNKTQITPQRHVAVLSPSPSPLTNNKKVNSVPRTNPSSKISFVTADNTTPGKNKFAGTKSKVTAALENPDLAQLTIERTVPALVETFPQETVQVTVPNAIGSQPSIKPGKPTGKPTFISTSTKTNQTLSPPKSNITAALENPDLAQLTIEHTVPAVFEPFPHETTQIGIPARNQSQVALQTTTVKPPLPPTSLLPNKTVSKSNITAALENPDLAQLTIEHTVPALVEGFPQETIIKVAAVSNQSQINILDNSTLVQTLKPNDTSTVPLPLNATQALENPDLAQVTIEHTVPALVESSPQVTNEISAENVISNQTLISSSTTVPIFPDFLINATIGAPMEKNTEAPHQQLQANVTSNINGSNILATNLSIASPAQEIFISQSQHKNEAVLKLAMKLIRPIAGSNVVTDDGFTITNNPQGFPLPVTARPTAFTPETNNPPTNSGPISETPTVSTPPENIRFNTSETVVPPSASIPELDDNNKHITIASNLSPASVNVSRPESQNVIFRTKTTANINIIFETEVLAPGKTNNIPVKTGVASQTINIPIKIEIVPGTTNIPPKSQIQDNAVISPIDSRVTENTSIPPKDEISETTIIPPKDEISETTIIPPKDEISETTIIPQKSEPPQTTYIPPKLEETTTIPPKKEISKPASTPPISEIIIFLQNSSIPIKVTSFNITNEILRPSMAATTTPEPVGQMIISEIMPTPLVPPPLSIFKEKLPFEDVHIPTTTTRRTNEFPTQNGNLKPVPPQSELLEGNEVPTLGSTEIPFSTNIAKRNQEIILRQRPRPFRIRVTSGGEITIPEDANSFRHNNTGSNTDVECQFFDRDNLKRYITATAFSRLNGEPTLLTFANNSECVGILSKTGRKEVRSISKIFPNFPFGQRQVLAGAFYNDSVLFFDDSEEQNVWRFTYDSASHTYAKEPQQFWYTTKVFLKEYCGIQDVHFNIKAIVQFSSTDNSCILFDRSSNLLLSPHASDSARSLAQVIVGILETEFVQYVEAIFAWLDEPEVSYVYVFGSNGEVYETFRDSSTDFKWKKGSYRVVPYEDFPLR